jgi:hypothetical protein
MEYLSKAYMFNHLVRRLKSMGNKVLFRKDFMSFA